VYRWSVSGTHKADYLGVPATGRRVELRGITVARFEDGRIANEVVYYDRLAVLEQLGVVPANREAVSAAS
jgi:steroid delta-isomerase-like uncharacterized protein